MKELVFGDTNSFAIRYKPSSNPEDNKKYGFLHLILKGQIIGDLREESYLPTWVTSIKAFRNKLKSQLIAKDNNPYDLEWLDFTSNNTFRSLNFEMLSIDETTDAWLIATSVENQNVKFVWKGLRNPCPELMIDKLYSCDIEKQIIIGAIDAVIKEIELK